MRLQVDDRCWIVRAVHERVAADGLECSGDFGDGWSDHRWILGWRSQLSLGPSAVRELIGRRSRICRPLARIARDLDLAVADRGKNHAGVVKLAGPPHGA